MIYSMFSENGRMISLRGTSEDLELTEYVHLGDKRDFYIENGNFVLRREFIVPESGSIDCGIRVEGDTLAINGVWQAVEGALIIEFSEPGEYDISIDFLEYAPKTFTVIVP